MSEARQPGTWWYFDNRPHIQYYLCLDAEGYEIWQDENNFGTVGEPPLYEIYDCTGFSHDFKIPPVPEAYADKWQHCDPPEFRKPTDGDTFIQADGRLCDDVSDFLPPDLAKPKRWILEPVPVPEPVEEPKAPRTVTVGLVAVSDGISGELIDVMGPCREKPNGTDNYIYRWLGPRTTLEIQDD